VGPRLTRRGPRFPHVGPLPVKNAKSCRGCTLLPKLQSEQALERELQVYGGTRMLRTWRAGPPGAARGRVRTGSAAVAGSGGEKYTVAEVGTAEQDRTGRPAQLAQATARAQRVLIGKPESTRRGAERHRQVATQELIERRQTHGRNAKWIQCAASRAVHGPVASRNKRSGIRWQCAETCMNETRAAERIEADRELVADRSIRGEIESRTAGVNAVEIADTGVRPEGILPRAGCLPKSASRAWYCVGRGGLILVRIPARSRRRRIQTAGRDFRRSAGDGGRRIVRQYCWSGLVGRLTGDLQRSRGLLRLRAPDSPSASQQRGQGRGPQCVSQQRPTDVPGPRPAAARSRQWGSGSCALNRSNHCGLELPLPEHSPSEARRANFEPTLANCHRDPLAILPHRLRRGSGVGDSRTV
jgi:hypothetical protein